MENMTVFILGIALLSAGTYLMRLGGAKLGSRLALSERSQALLSDAATVLLFSVALATTFYEGAQGAVDFRDRRGGSGDGVITPGGHKLKKRPGGALSTDTSLLFVQLSGHVHTVTGERLSNGVRGRASLLGLSRDFSFCAINGAGGCGNGLRSERTERSSQSDYCDKSFDAFHDSDPCDKLLV